MSNAQSSQRHSLEGNSKLHNANYTDPAAQVNQGIVGNRPEGQQPRTAPVTLDTYVNRDASATPSSPPPVTRVSDTLTGATSPDVHNGLGHPGQGMSSKELRHDGQPGRKRYGEGTDQFGQEHGRGNGSKKLDGTGERRFVAIESGLRRA